MKNKKPSQKKATAIQPVAVEQLHFPDKKIPQMVRLANMRTGRVVRMGGKAAQMLSDKYPKEFKILQ